MNVETVWAVCFSATDTTRRVTEAIARPLAGYLGASYRLYDFTLPEARKAPPAFGPGDLVIFGTPVYAGRVPNLLLPFVKGVRGAGTPAVPVVCYGNRAFDDALMELRNLLAAGGFLPVAGAAFSCQHAFSRTQNAGRPDVSDLTIARGFAWQVGKKVAGGDLTPVAVPGNDPVGPYYTPRDRHGTPIDILKVVPETTEACIHCGLCARECPLGSIDPEDETRMRGRCMKCNRCVRHCPVGAKVFTDPNYLYHKTELEEQYSWPRQTPSLFV